MRKPPIVLLVFLAACSSPAGRGDRPAEREDRMAWWREARFGMFVHWGLYAIPGGEWGERKDHGEWIRTTAQIPLERYEELREKFDPVRFDADAWVGIARRAGMRYLVVTSKHHDGFCLYDSAETDWDVASTPFRRDVLAELSAACGRQGVRFCTYHSIMDWHHPDYLPRRDWEERPVEGADFDRFERYLHAQVREIVTRYRPAVMWFDGEWERTWTHERGARLFDLCRSLDSRTLVNNRVDVHRGGMAGFSGSAEAVGDFGTPEQEVPATGVPGVDWETCMTMNDHWGWNRSDRNWKSAKDLVRLLVDVASKGGNFLLNVGPTPEGEIPAPSVERLEAIGRWMETNGEAIHGTSSSPIPDLAWGRCTMKRRDEASRLYLHVFDWPPNGMLVVPGLGNEVVAARLLAEPGRALEVARAGADVRIRVPAKPPDAFCPVVALDLKGAPVVYRAPRIEAAASTFVRPIEAKIVASSEDVEVRYTLDGAEPDASAEKYAAPLRISETTTVKARAFHRGRPVSPVAERRFERATPRPGLEVDFPAEGLRLQVFEGDWDRLPNFPALVPAKTGTASEISVGEGPRRERIGRVLEGFLRVPRDDAYVFSLASDDGARLAIGDAIVVDNDGLHGIVEKRGVAALAAGLHPIRVEWFNKTGEVALEVRMAPVGEEPRAIPASSLRSRPVGPVLRPPWRGRGAVRGVGALPPLCAWTWAAAASLPAPVDGGGGGH